MPPPPMSTEEEASNGQWQGPLVMLQPALLIAFSIVSEDHIWLCVVLILCILTQKMWAPVVCLNGGALQRHTRKVPPSPLTLWRPSTADERHACTVQHRVVFALYISESLHPSLPNTVPFNVALLLLILTKKAECGLCSLLSKVTYTSSLLP